MDDYRLVWYGTVGGYGTGSRVRPQFRNRYSG